MIKKLQDSKIKAMKDKDTIAKAILSLLHSDALNLAKKDNRPITDKDIIRCAKTLIKRNNQTINEIKKATGNPAQLESEVKILLGYLPAQKDKEDIQDIVLGIIEKIPKEERTKKAQGGIMKQIKDKYGDAVDMSIASKYVGGLLT